MEGPVEASLNTTTHSVEAAPSILIANKRALNVWLWTKLDWTSICTNYIGLSGITDNFDSVQESLFVKYWPNIGEILTIFEERKLFTDRFNDPDWIWEVQRSIKGPDSTLGAFKNLKEHVIGGLSFEILDK